VRQGLVAIQKLAAVGKGIRRDVEDAHDQRALAQFERTCAQIPLEDGSHVE